MGGRSGFRSGTKYLGLADERDIRDFGLDVDVDGSGRDLVVILLSSEKERCHLYHMIQSEMGEGNMRRKTMKPVASRLFRFDSVNGWNHDCET